MYEQCSNPFFVSQDDKKMERDTIEEIVRHGRQEENGEKAEQEQLASPSHSLTDKPETSHPSDDTGKSNCTEGDAPTELDTFDCNICFDTASEPVVTMCGHLYW